MKKFIFILTSVLAMMCTSGLLTVFFRYFGSSGEGVGPMAIVVGVLIGIVVAVIIMIGHKNKLMSVHMERAAGNYIKQGSFKLTTSREIYLYKRVERREKPKQNNN